MSDTPSIDRIWPDPESGLDDAAVLALTAFPADRTWLRVNFISSIDGAATRHGLSGGLGDDADHRVVQPNIGHHRPARLERGQEDRLPVDDLGLAARKDGVAVPPHRRFPTAERHGLPRRLVEQIVPDHLRARAEAAIGLLQTDDIGVDLAQHVEDALGPAPPIGADPLAHIVARDLDHSAQVTRKGLRGLRKGRLWCPREDSNLRPAV